MISWMDQRFVSLRDKTLQIKWQDGLPIDIQERTDTIIKQFGAGLKSRETAVKELNEINTEEALAEIEKIDADARTSAEIQASTLPAINV
jgi:hypothetical protein